MFKDKLKISYYGATKTEDGIGLASKLHLEALKKNNSYNNNLLIKEYDLSRNASTWARLRAFLFILLFSL